MWKLPAGKILGRFARGVISTSGNNYILLYIAGTAPPAELTPPLVWTLIRGGKGGGSHHCVRSLRGDKGEGSTDNVKGEGSTDSNNMHHRRPGYPPPVPRNMRLNSHPSESEWCEILSHITPAVGVQV